MLTTSRAVRPKPEPGPSNGETSTNSNCRPAYASCKNCRSNEPLYPSAITNRVWGENLSIMWQITGLAPTDTKDLFKYWQTLPNREPVPAAGINTLNSISGPGVIIPQSNHIIHFRCRGFQVHAVVNPLHPMDNSGRQRNRFSRLKNAFRQRLARRP